MLLFASSGVWLLSLEGDRKPQSFIDTPCLENSARFSLDARWGSYDSNPSGRSEVYVQPFPGPGERVQISTEGGEEPVWARNGRELFYRNGSKMMAVDVSTQSGFSAGAPRRLFEGQYTNSPTSTFGYDVSADGQRFLMIQAVEPEQSATQINLVLNWFEELKKKVPSGQ